MLSRFFKKRAQEPVHAYAYINMRIMPETRGQLFEEPLSDAIEARGFAVITGGGTGGGQSNEHQYELQHCGIDINIDPQRLEAAARFICEFLTCNGAPRGSHLDYTAGGKDITIPFGYAEGIAIYLNRTDLPPEVYRANDEDAVVQELCRLVDPPAGGHAVKMGHYQSPAETILYFYGKSSARMRSAIAGFMATHPLCQRARVVDIA